ncbi:MAG: hypothetical protein CVU44_12815 [Chloroflexi bacterium HGW-Chloroflexi-6]|nr:MAG: hypothetical protein CVU44_12815 [Chloroflexi bacterium HGW-Chloroflexi-6]
MDKLDLTLPPSLDTALNDFYTAPEPYSAFASRLELSLHRRHQALIAAQASARQRKTFMQTLRARPVFVLLLVLLALALLTGAAYAIGRLSGFIPGFGFTSDSGAVYTLAEPGEISLDGVTLRSLQATSDLQKFTVTIEQIGRPTQATRAFAHAVILLPDGSEASFRQGSGDDPSASQVLTTLEFDPLPPGTQQLTLRYDLMDENDVVVWHAELPIRLRPLRAEEIIPAPAGSDLKPLASQNHDGLSIVLENIAAASDKTVLQVALHFDQPGTNLNSDWNVTLTGADGIIYPLTQVMNDSENRVKTYETVPFKGGESLTLSLTAFPDPRNLPLSLDLSGDAPAFPFDPGPNPQAGQTWHLDETLSAGRFILKVTSAQLTNLNTLVFTLQSDDSANGVMLYSEKASGSRGGMPTSENTFSAELTFAPLPTEPFEIRLMRVNYTARGEWNITWQAPAAPSGVLVGGTSTPAPTQSAYTSPTPAFSDPLWLELVRLTESFDAPFQQGLGWVHYVTKTETTPRAGQTFPPPYIKSEQWLEIDEAGYITRTLHTDYDEAGNIIQRTVTVGDYFINFTVGDSGYLGGERYRFSSSSLLADFNAALENSNAAVSIEETQCDNGLPCYLVTFIDIFGASNQNSGEAQSFCGSARQVWVDKMTGQTLKTRVLLRLADGTEQVDHTNTTLLLEKLDMPPQDVVDILEKVIVP